MTKYLNNSGHRWVNFDSNNKRDRAKVWFPDSNKVKNYSIDFWEAIGNFGVPYIRVKGKRVQLMPSNRKEGFWVPNTLENRENNY